MLYRSSVRLAIAAAITLALSACGGGGGNDGPPADDDAPRVAITQDNAATVAAEAVDAGDAASTADTAAPTGAPSGAQAAPSAATRAAISALVREVRAGLQRREREQAAAAETLTCEDGGTVDVTVDVASDQRPTAGDTFEFDFNDCEQFDVTLNGVVLVRLVDFNNDLSLLVADYSMTRLTGTIDDKSSRLSGTARVTLDASSATRATLSFRSRSTTHDRLGDGGSVQATQTLSDYAYDIDVSKATGNASVTFSYEASGTFPNLGSGSFEARTTAPIVVVAGDERPSSGVVEITGADDSSVVATVIDGGVRLEVDEDGDGSVDRTLERSWDELDAEL